jgi:scyllo-inositol 2-dehydrogenase (NADP+)
MNESAELRVALIGYGVAGAFFHAPTIACTKGLVLAAVVTNNAERQRQVKSEYPASRLLNDAGEVFAAADSYDLVVVAAPNKFHHSLTKRALESGLSVVVDKPAAPSSEEIVDLIETSKRVGKLFTVYQNRRLDGDFLTVRKIIQNDLLGKITYFSSRFDRFRPALRPGSWRESASLSEGGGVLFDLGSHLVDQACVLFGRPESVYAEVRRLREGVQVDDDFSLSLRFGTVTAHLGATTIARIPGARFKLNGFKGSFEKQGLDPQEDALRKGLKPGSAGWGQEPKSAWGRFVTTTADVTVEGLVETEAGCYQAFYENVRDCLRGKTALLVDPQEAVVTTKVIEAGFTSAREGRVVVL